MRVSKVRIRVQGSVRARVSMRVRLGPAVEWGLHPVPVLEWRDS